jgi:opacity protein-like surface antigen
MLPAQAGPGYNTAVRVAGFLSRSDCTNKFRSRLMKLQHLFKTVGLMLCLGATSGWAQYYSYRPMNSGPYFRLGLGPSVFEDGRLTQFGGPTDSTIKFRTGFAGDGAIGYAFNRYVAADFEVGGVGAEIKSVPPDYFSYHTYLGSVSYLANVTLSCPIPRTIVVPYVGIGAGGSTVVFDTDGFGEYNYAQLYGSDSDTVFAWQARAGLRFRLNSQMSLGVGYKYFATEDFSFGYSSAFPIAFDGIRAHSVMFIFEMQF